MEEDDPAESERRVRGKIRARIVLGLIVGLSLVLRIAMVFSTGLTDPAGLITLRFSVNIAAGNGFVYNVGERILGTTTPLFALLVAAGIKLGLPCIGFAKALGVLSDGALCVAIAAWLRSVALGRVATIAAFLVAVDPHLCHWAISGTETSLVTLGIASAFYAFAARRIALCYGVLAVLFLLRWDTALLTAVITLALVHRDRKIPVRGIALFVALVTPWVIFATSYFGSPIPITFSAKTAILDRLARTSRLEHVRDILGLFVTIPSDCAITVAAIIGLVGVVAKRKSVLWPALIWSAVYWGAYAVSKLPTVPKYATPTLPVHLALASIGLALLSGCTVSRWPGAKYAVVGGLVLTSSVPLRAMERNARAHENFERDVRRGVALWIKEHSEPTDRVMITYGSSVGTFGYYSERPILDSKGIVTPVTLSFWAMEHRSPDFDIARSFRPRWCVLRSGELAPIERAAAAVGASWSDEYDLIKSFPIDREESYQIFRRRKDAIPPARL